MQALAIEMTDDGLLSIPADVRQRLNLKPGKKLILQVSDEEEDINPFTGRPHAPYLGIDAGRGFAKTFRKCRPTDEWMKELREGEQE